MKKALIALTLALVILCCAAAACAEGDVKRDQLKVGLRMNVPGKTGATMEAGDTVQITLRITNASGADFASEMYLFDPAKERAGEFPLLKDGESAEWSGEWTVTEEQMEAGKFTYRLQFKYFDENGESKASYKNLNMKITRRSPEMPRAPHCHGISPAPQTARSPSAFSDSRSERSS